MKKILLFIFIVILLCCVNLTAVQNLTLDKIFPNAMVEVFLQQKGNLIDHKTIANGQGEIVYCDIQDLDYILNQNLKVTGYTLKIHSCEIDILNLLNVNDVQQQNFGIYGFSEMLENYAKKFNLLTKKVKINQKMVNFQYINKNDYILIGFPILLGSY